MTNQEIIEQLKNLRTHCEDWTKSELSDKVWQRDVEALDAAIEFIERNGGRVTCSGKD